VSAAPPGLPAGAGPGGTRFERADACADALVERLGGRIVLGLPLGLGKAAALANALYARAKADPAIELEICTALTLEVPKARSPLEASFLDPIAARLFRDCPALDYATDQRRGQLPANVRVVEFYFRPGANLGLPVAQQNYASLNYTHAAREMVARGVNVVAQLVSAPRATDAGACYSLSCNPDVTLDLLDVARLADRPRPLLVGEINPRLPFMPHDAVLAAAGFDALIADPACDAPLFPVPNRPVPLAEHAIALQVAALIRDGGTLQIGIGSLGDAIAHAIALRRRNNDAFRALLAALTTADERLPFELDGLPVGLYGCSEMFVEGFLHLRRHGVLTRTVPGGYYLHGGFFLGSARFYQALRDLPESERLGINMTRISFTNSLLGDEVDKRRDRQHGRFVNTAMMVTLLGAAVSDALEDGRVVSGVGGQYNFVAMAHELAGARSILMVPATRTARGRVASNIVWNYGHTTIPRHLRDIVVTEYGVADLRGQSDRDVIAAMLNLADSRFQQGLLEQAIRAGKLEVGYRIPARYRDNRPERLAARLEGSGGLAELPWYPLGSDFTAAESALAIGLGALGELQGDRKALLRLAWRGWRLDDPRLEPLLARVGLAKPQKPRERLLRAVLSAALHDLVLDSGRPLVAGD
jgi:acyl-CoA hydrolase